MADVEISRGDSTGMTVRVPMALRKRGGRKLVVSPPGHEPWAPQRRRVDSTLVKALVRSFRWRTQLEHGEHCSLRDIAAAECISPSYVARIMNLSLLARTIVEKILDGYQPRMLNAEALSRGLPDDWNEQARLID